jgi:hypothetical protein
VFYQVASGHHQQEAWEMHPIGFEDLMAYDCHKISD